MKVDVIKKYFQSWLDNDVEIVKQTFLKTLCIVNAMDPNIMAYHKL